MLILTRRYEEAIHIGEAKVVVLGIKSGQVKLGIEAPDDVNIVREELLKVPRKPGNLHRPHPQRGWRG